MIRYYKCVVCGKREIDSSNTQNKKFCSGTCKSAYYNKNRYTGASCMFNEGVSCEKHNCRNCGWNPVVAKIRMGALV